MGDWIGNTAAVLVLFLTFAVPFCFSETRKDGRTALCFWTLLALRHIVAIVNTYYFVVEGATEDAAIFHSKAASWALWGHLTPAIGSKFYLEFLGIVYRAVGESIFLGGELSIVAFAMSCVVFLKILNLIGIRRHHAVLLMLYGLLPSSVLLTSVTLRESFEILFFMLSVYWGLKARMNARRGSAFLAGLSAMAMGLFHKGLIVLAFFIVLILLWPQRKPDRRLNLSAGIRPWRRIAVTVLALSIVACVFIHSGLISQNSVFMQAFSGSDVLDHIRTFRERAEGIDARTTYAIRMDDTNPALLTKTFAHIFLSYMLFPLPWMVTNALDIYAICESSLRAVLILFAVFAWRKKAGQTRDLWAVMLTIYLAASLLWAIGTVNYGTAIRHHLTHYWIIVALGGDSLFGLLRRTMPVPPGPALIGQKGVEEA